MSLTVKAFFYEDFSRASPVPSEIRRFSVDTDVSSSYAYLTQKLANVLAGRGVQANAVATFWQDVDGDFVTFSSDEELVEALGSIDGDMFKVHVHRVEPREPDVSQSCEAERQQWGRWRPPQQGWGGFHGFGHGAPFWHGCHQPRWGRCISRREERRQQRRQDQEQQKEKGHAQRDQSAAEENETQSQKFERQGKGRHHQLTKLGKAVAAALEPFGVEVDVDVNDDTTARQKEEQCCESDSDQEPAVPSEEPVETSQEESDAAYAVAAQAQEFHDAATQAVVAVTGVAPPYPYEHALAQLKEMGFDDDGGWLTNLLHAKGGDIGRVLDAIQPQSRKM